MRLITVLKLSLAASITLSLTGCGLFIKDKPLVAENKVISQAARHQQVMNMGSWRVNGSIGVTARGKSDSGTFTWTQNGQHYDFQTFGPLNMAGIRIQGQPGRVMLWKNANNRVFARTPEQLMAKELGWYLPLTNLQYWARGIAAPGEKGNAQYDRFGHLTRLQQQGWLIEYRRFQGVNGMDLPQLVVLKQKSLRAKIAFKRWSVKKT